MRLVDKILAVGAENCMFLVPMKPLNVIGGLFAFTSSDDDNQIIPCKINEENYPLSREYKISLEPIVEGFATEHFYITDLSTLIREGTVKFLVPATKPEVRFGQTKHEIQ